MARGTEPCLICRSLVQILLMVTLTMASCSSIRIGFFFSVKPNTPCFNICKCFHYDCKLIIVFIFVYRTIFLFVIWPFCQIVEIFISIFLRKYTKNIRNQVSNVYPKATCSIVCTKKNQINGDIQDNDFKF